MTIQLNCSDKVCSFYMMTNCYQQAWQGYFRNRHIFIWRTIIIQVYLAITISYLHCINWTCIYHIIEYDITIYKIVRSTVLILYTCVGWSWVWAEAVTSCDLGFSRSKQHADTTFPRKSGHVVCLWMDRTDIDRSQVIFIIYATRSAAEQELTWLHCGSKAKNDVFRVLLMCFRVK